MFEKDRGALLFLLLMLPPLPLEEEIASMPSPP
jgi:hypothetical protein